MAGLLGPQCPWELASPLLPRTWQAAPAGELALAPSTVAVAAFLKQKADPFSALHASLCHSNLCPAG